MKYTDIVKNNTVEMVHVSSQFATYKISYENETYQFDVPLSELGTATLKPKDKAFGFCKIY